MVVNSLSYHFNVQTLYSEQNNLGDIVAKWHVAARMQCHYPTINVLN
jgi:hypothetical protein